MGANGVRQCAHFTNTLVEPRREAFMKTVLEVRRQKLLRELARVNQQISRTQKQLATIESRLTLANKAQSKAA